MWNGFNVEMNYKECLYKCGLKEKQGKNFTFGDGVCLKKERRKLSGSCQLICLARLDKGSSGLSIVSGLVSERGNTSES